jgi:hypothetical protein
MLGNTRFISRVEHDISLEINLIFPRTHVLFSIYWSLTVQEQLFFDVRNTKVSSQYKGACQNYLCKFILGIYEEIEILIFVTSHR